MGLLVEVPPIDEKGAIEVIEKVREGVKRGEIKYLAQIGGEYIEKVEKYITKLVAVKVTEELLHTRVIKRASFEWASITPSSVDIRLEVWTHETDMCSSGDLACISAKVDEICRKKGYEGKLVLRYPGKRVVAKKHVVLHGDGVSYHVSASLGAEGAGLEAITDPEATAGLLAHAIAEMLLV